MPGGRRKRRLMVEAASTQPREFERAASESNDQKTGGYRNQALLTTRRRRVTFIQNGILDGINIMVPLWSFLFFGQANQQTAELLAGNQNLDDFEDGSITSQHKTPSHRCM